MKFTNQYPKKEITIETIKTIGSLIADHKAVFHYRDYKGYKDSTDYIRLEGDKNAWYGIKTDFLYDTLMDKVKDVYADSFGRKMRVEKSKQMEAVKKKYNIHLDMKTLGPGCCRQVCKKKQGLPEPVIED